MTDDREQEKRSETAKDRDQVKDLNAKPIDEKDAQQVKGGRLDESPKELR